MGKHMRKTLAFAIRYRDQWHSFARDRETRRAVSRLVELGFIEVNAFNQFRLIPAAY
jgi:hypothetical protein